jgi:hypothetical protein
MKLVVNFDKGQVSLTIDGKEAATLNSSFLNNGEWYLSFQPYITEMNVELLSFDYIPSTSNSTST